MKLSKVEAEELVELSKSAKFREDMQKVRAGRHNPFIKDGVSNPDAYIEFVTQYNEFINHQPKPFKPIIIKYPILL